MPEKFGIVSCRPEMDAEQLLESIKKGMVFLYPTDTVYGLGCNALDEKAVAGIYKIKGRDSTKPLSVIAPSIEWILENFRVSEEDVKNYLPGPYTIIAKKKDRKFLSAVSAGDNVGIRIPEHPITKLIQKANVPFVTTSANLSGGKSPASLEDVPAEIKGKVDVILIGNCILKKPSTIIDMAAGKTIER